MSSQDVKKLVGKLVQMTGSVNWLAFPENHMIGCIVDAAQHDDDIHVWVHWSDGLQTWERLSESYLVLIDT